MKTVWKLAAALAAGIALAHAEPAPVPVEKRIVLLVDEWKAVRNLPVVVAERLGYFRGDDMDVTVMNTRDDVWHGDMLMDGRIDAVMAYWHHNAVNQSRGRDTQAIVTLGVTPGAKVLVATQARERFRTVADLKGARFIAGGAGSSKTTVANALVLAGGLQLADYTRLGTGGKEQNVAALREGRADFVVAPTPGCRVLRDAGRGDAVCRPDHGRRHANVSRRALPDHHGVHVHRAHPAAPGDRAPPGRRLRAGTPLHEHAQRRGGRGAGAGGGQRQGPREVPGRGEGGTADVRK